MNVPSGLWYSSTDEWVRQDGAEVTVGVTDYAQQELGEVVYAELPEAGTVVAPGATFGVVESVKAVAELSAPVGGTVTARNEAVLADPALVNQDPYAAGWLIRVTLDGELPTADLMTPEAYREARASA